MREVTHRRGRTRRWVMLALASWVALAVAKFFTGWLITKLWLLGLAVLGLTWSVAVVTSVVAAAVMIRRRGTAAGLLAAAAAFAIALLAWTADWRTVYAHVWFHTHRAEFATVTELVESGRLGAPGTWNYYGPQLPYPHSSLSVTGSISPISPYDRGSDDPEPDIFLPAYTGIPDGAIGFIHTDRAVAPQYDAYGDPIKPRIDLGGGWWWAD